MKSRHALQFMAALACLMVVTVGGGCVERLIHVRSEPDGANVWLNGREVGPTPLTVPFTFYGEYDVTLRKDGYQTLHTSRKTEEPFYQWIGVDLIAEVLVPFMLTDEHGWEFVLEPTATPDPNAVIRRALDFQESY